MRHIKLIETRLLAFVLTLAAIAYVMSQVMPAAAFGRHWMIREDGLLENATFAVLAAAAVICLSRAWRFRQRGRGYVAGSALLGLLLAFGAGEEVSWGQRLLGIEPAEFFLRHNLQKETNLHNLTVAGVNLNRLVFGKLLAVALGVYLLPIRWLHQRQGGLSRLLDRWAVPIPRLRHVVAILAVVLVVETSRAPKRGEISEFALSSIFLLVLINPQNRQRLLAPGRAPASAGGQPPQLAAFPTATTASRLAARAPQVKRAA